MKYRDPPVFSHFLVSIKNYSKIKRLFKKMLTKMHLHASVLGKLLVDVLPNEGLEQDLEIRASTQEREAKGIPKVMF